MFAQIPTTWKMLSVGLMLAAAVGCQEPKQEPPVDVSYHEGDRLNELESQLANALRDLGAANDRIRALQAENDRLARDLASKPEPAPGWTNVPGGAMTSIEGTVLFDSGKVVLKSSAKGTLDEIARVIGEKFPGYDVYVFGHTDDVPIRVSGWKDNYELSAQRALSVVRYLYGAGVSQDMLAGGWGDRRPVAPGTSSMARQANRRVEIFAMAPPTGGANPTAATPPGTR